jgi:hypothetical protein
VGVQSSVPSGLFPAGPSRPTFREPHPVRAGSVLIAAALALAWQVLLTLSATTLRGAFWLSVLAVGVGWAVAGLLLRLGDRGAAAGVAVVGAAGGSFAAILVAVRWFSVGWPLW